jgi:O-antigen/teichoic acid export membrane protein
MLPLNQLTAPVQSMSEPLFSALQDAAEKYKRGFQKKVSALSLITMPLAAGIFICSAQIVTLLLGQRWMAAVEIVRILATAAFLQPAISMIGFVMISRGKTARYMALGILDSIALVATVSVGVLWGARGVAIGHVAATYIVLLPFVWWALKGTPVELTLWLRSIARPLACSLITVAVLYLPQAQIPLRDGFAAWSLSVVLASICYFAGMLALPDGRVALSSLLHDLQSAVK